MEKFFILKRLDKGQYFGTYRGDDYWTSNISEAYRFKEKSYSLIDENTVDFLREADTYFEYVEIFEIV